MMDGQINPLHPEQVFQNGEGYKVGIYIQSTIIDGYAGPPVSKGCLLLAPKDFDDFDNKMQGIQSFVLVLNRKIII